MGQEDIKFLKSLIKDKVKEIWELKEKINSISGTELDKYVFNPTNLVPNKNMKKKFILLYMHEGTHELIYKTIRYGKKWKYDSIEEAQDVIKDISVETSLFDVTEGAYKIEEVWSF